MSSLDMNLRITTHSEQGGRKYMEDMLSVKFKKSEDGKKVEYTYLAVYDGHGGVQAANFAKQHLLNEITKQKGFWSSEDDVVVKAIRDGFHSCHQLMWKNLASWPRTVLGHPSTSGTTVSVVFIKNGKLYIAHVGDSNVVLGLKKKDSEDNISGECVTVEHKPDAPKELERIKASGGSVVAKAGVQRVVWNRPKKAHVGPVRRSTPIDKIPFLAIARALGDLWSYNSDKDIFVVSPDPDISVHKLDLDVHKCLIIASDGLWNMVKSEEAALIVKQLDEQSRDERYGLKPAKVLVQYALSKWRHRQLRADNTSVIVAYLDPATDCVSTPSSNHSTSDDSELDVVCDYVSGDVSAVNRYNSNYFTDLYTIKRQIEGKTITEVLPPGMASAGSVEGICQENSHRTIFIQSEYGNTKTIMLNSENEPIAEVERIMCKGTLLGKHRAYSYDMNKHRPIPRCNSTQVLNKSPPGCTPMRHHSPQSNNANTSSARDVMSPSRLIRSVTLNSPAPSHSPSRLISSVTLDSSAPSHSPSRLIRSVTLNSPAAEFTAIKSRRRHNSGSGGRQVGGNLTNSQPLRARSHSVGSTAKSPIKSAMISPIWPSGLDSDLKSPNKSPKSRSSDQQQNTSTAKKSSTCSGENRVLKQARRVLKIFSSRTEEEPTSPVTRSGVKRKQLLSAFTEPSTTSKKRKVMLSSGSTTKMSSTLHRTILRRRLRRNRSGKGGNS